MSHRALRSALCLAAAWLLLAAPPAQAGCGCDHPPPAWAEVMPPFASPGKTITIHGDADSFRVGKTYEVEFGSGIDAMVVAEHTDALRVKMPMGVDPGPVELRVRGEDFDFKYPESLFTALPPAFVLPDKFFHAELADDFPAAVTTDGTLLVPIDVSQVLAAKQFAFLIRDLPLTFAQDDVVFYNADGVDLTLFTLEVDDPTERQWGSYFGWRVEQDRGIHGDVYEEKVMDRGWLDHELAKVSDILTYWRHEFYTYSKAHMPGGSHEVNESGYHADGTLHIDHGHLVLAIAGGVRDLSDPTADPRPLDPGELKIDVVAVEFESDKPVEPQHVGFFMDFMSLGKLGPSGSSGSGSGWSHSDDDD